MTWLVVGLGNPGPTYAHTRHNVGFMTADVLAERAAARFSAGRTMKAELTDMRLGGDKVVIAKPLTFMNESGQSVGKIAKFLKIEPDHVVVVHDELDLDLGQLRCKLGGGDNGHNGLKSIRAHLGTGDFLRVRIGIGRPPGRQPSADYVLSQIPQALTEEIGVSVQTAADAVESLITAGLVETQNRFNS